MDDNRRRHARSSPDAGYFLTCTAAGVPAPSNLSTRLLDVGSARGRPFGSLQLLPSSPLTEKCGQRVVNSLSQQFHVTTTRPSPSAVTAPG